MNYPECPINHLHCRFIDEGGTRTLMDSPIVRDRNGKAIGGGNNRVMTCLHCTLCERRWIATRTELEIAQEATVDWKILE